MAIAAIALTALATMAPRAQAQEAGAAAPDGTWLMEGGAASRSSVALTRPPRGPLVRAWEVSLGTAIDGDPLVWDQFVLVAVRERPGRNGTGRSLVLLRLDDGTEIARASIATDEPLQPQLWGQVAFVHGPGRSIVAYGFGAEGLTELWSYDASGNGVDAFLVHDGEVYVNSNGTLTRIDAGCGAADPPLWTQGGGFRGALALRGKRVYGLATLRGGRLVAINRTTGAREAEADILRDVPSTGHPFPCIHAGGAVVHLDADIQTEAGHAADTAYAEFVDGGALIPGDGLLTVEGRTVEWGPGWVGVATDEGVRRELRRTVPGGRWNVLASLRVRPDLVISDMFPSRASSTAYLGSRVLELESTRLVANLPAEPVRRVVPARGTLLVAESGGVLVALRGTNGGSASGAQLIGIVPTTDDGSQAPFQAPFDGRAALVDGSVLQGLVTIAPGGLAFSVTGREDAVPLTQTLLIEDAAGVTVAAAPGRAVLLGAERIDAATRGAAYAEVALRAVNSKDLALAGRLLIRARALGASADQTKKAQKRYLGYRKLKREPKPNAKKARGVVKELAALNTTGPTTPLSRYAKLPEDAPLWLRTVLLRAAHARDDDHDQGADASAVASSVAALLPEGLAGSDLEPSEGLGGWIDFLAAQAAVGVELMPLPRAEAEDLEPGERMLGQLLGTWRKDLRAFRSPQITAVGPATHPASLARCLSLGELVCDMLEAWCASAASGGSESSVGERDPLIVALYETEAEYRKFLGERTLAPTRGRAAEWAFATYDEGDGMSRMFIRGGAPESLDVVESALAAQWLRERWASHEPREGEPDEGETDEGEPDEGEGDAGEQPGCWVEQGLAEMAAGMRFDLEARTWAFDPHADALALLAALSSEKLLGWRSVLVASNAGVGALSAEVRVKLDHPQRLGLTRELSDADLFGIQAGALATYLFHGEDGKHRAKYLELLAGSLQGEFTLASDVFGTTPNELGARVVKYARDLQKR